MARYSLTFNMLDIYIVYLVTIEVGSLSHFMPETVTMISSIYHLPKKSINHILQQTARVAISCSYRIFNPHTYLFVMGCS